MKLEVIEQPNAKLDFLKFKVGRKVKRHMVAPIIIKNGDRDIIAGEKTMAQKTEVFEWLGWGSTQAKAERMAAMSLVKLGG